jgi:hypothetical protein
MPQIYDWDFNVFDVAERSGSRPLFAVVMALLEDQGLLVRAAAQQCGVRTCRT